MSTGRYVTVAVTPAAPGAHVQYVSADGTHRTSPLIAWLTQDELEVDYKGSSVEAPGHRPFRRVVAGVLDEICLIAADEYADAWCVLVPGDQGLTPQEIAERAESVAKQQSQAGRPTP